MSPTIAATRAVADLLDTARRRRGQALILGEGDVVFTLASMIDALDATRTRLIQQGPEYIDTAWAIIDAARYMLAEIKHALDRAGLAGLLVGEQP